MSEKTVYRAATGGSNRARKGLPHRGTADSIYVPAISFRLNDRGVRHVESVAFQTLSASIFRSKTENLTQNTQNGLRQSNGCRRFRIDRPRASEYYSFCSRFSHSSHSSFAITRKIFVLPSPVSQINGKPVDDNDWAVPFETALKNLTSKFTEVVGNNSEYTNMAKNNLNAFVDNFKSELATLSKTVNLYARNLYHESFFLRVRIETSSLLNSWKAKPECRIL